jgi:hypothetical protein
LTVHPIVKLVGEIQSDLERANARFQALRAHLAAEDFAPVTLPVCVHGCGALHLPPTTSLEDHYRVMHDIDVLGAASAALTEADPILAAVIEEETT